MPEENASVESPAFQGGDSIAKLRAIVERYQQSGRLSGHIYVERNQEILLDEMHGLA